MPHIFLFFGTPSEFLDVDHISDTLLCVWILLSKQNVDVCFGRPDATKLKNKPRKDQADLQSKFTAYQNKHQHSA